RAKIGFDDMGVSCEAGDQQIALAFGIQQVPHVPRMHDIKCTMTHDDFFLARPRTDGCGDLVSRLDLMANKLLAGIVHHLRPLMSTGPSTNRQWPWQWVPGFLGAHRTNRLLEAHFASNRGRAGLSSS